MNREVVRFTPGDGMAYLVIFRRITSDEARDARYLTNAPPLNIMFGFGVAGNFPIGVAMFPDLPKEPIWEADFRGQLRIDGLWVAVAAQMVFGHLTNRPPAGVNYQTNVSRVVAVWHDNWRDQLSPLLALSTTPDGS